MTNRPDIHSYGNPPQVRVRHLDLDLTTDFDRRVLRGSASLSLVRTDPSVPLYLDTRDLKIEKVETAESERGPFQAVRFALAPADPILGSALEIELPPSAAVARITYETSPSSTAVQWLAPSQTAGGKQPFLFTQSEAIHARSWIPIQDSPGVRISYRARIRTPPDLIALMSARRDNRNVPGDYTFHCPFEIPSYLLALAVGDLERRYVSARTDVWAEAPLLDAAAKEFEDTERMIAAAEGLFGPYPWERFDILVLPPSFPFGGMENPMLTFATPTIIAGDKSLVSLIAHELAHSWSGNLVTNATWSDFWLNEGFTVYVERRIVEVVYGAERARMEAVLGREELEQEMADLPPEDQILRIDLVGRDPDVAVTKVAYEKGALFLMHLDQVFGRELFDVFISTWFREHAFKSVTADEFLRFLNEGFFSRDPKFAAQVPVQEWLTKPGIPTSAPRVTTTAFDNVRPGVSESETADWTTHHWLRFLRGMGDRPDMASLDQKFGFTQSGNSEILCEWLLASVRHGYRAADGKLEEFLLTVGRRKFVRPLYAELVKSAEGRERAAAVFAKARSRYHPITANTIDEILKKNGVPVEP